MLKHLITLSTALLLASCSGNKVLQLSEVDLASSDWSGTALMFHYSLTANDFKSIEGGCKLTLVNEMTDGSYSLELHPGSQDAIVLAPVGAYRAKHLICAANPEVHWTLQRFLQDSVDLVPNKINFAGNVKFTFGADGNLNIVYGDRKADSEALREAFGKLNPGWKDAVVSAYTRKPLKASMVPASASGHMEFQIKKFTPKEFPTESLQKTLQQCEVEEAKKFPLRIGTLQFFALYQDGKFQTLTKEVDDQAFSDELSGCFETALKAFTPPGPEKLEFRVKL